MEANQEEITEVEEYEWYLRRMDAGLSSLQNADYILAWVCMEDDGVSRASFCAGFLPCDTE
jgi:beta-catenin-like protein 1